MMSEDEFWKLVEQTRTDESADPDGDDHVDRINAELRTRGLDAAQDAYRIYWQIARDAYRWDLWGVAYLVNGGCSDDGFDYFRGWLVRQGRKAYESVLADADTLPRFLNDRDYFESESILGIGGSVIEDLGGEFPPLEPEGEPTGEEWDEEDLDSRFPKTAAWAAENQ